MIFVSRAYSSNILFVYMELFITVYVYNVLNTKYHSYIVNPGAGVDSFSSDASAARGAASPGRCRSIATLHGAMHAGTESRCHQQL